MLAKAAQVFRERGYAGTSMQALSKAMNMGEQSIYNAFGSKEEVFSRALEQYCVEAKSGFGPLAEPDASLPQIEAFFAGLVKHTTSGAPACLVTQTCLDLEERGDKVAKQVTQHMRGLEKKLLVAVKNAVANKEIECDDPKAVARYLNTTIQGLSVLAKSGTSAKALREVVKVALQALR